MKCTVVRLEAGDGVHLLRTETFPADLGENIHERFPQFFRDYSRTERRRYWANHCASCGALQGDYFVTENTFQRPPTSVWPIPVSTYLVEPSWHEEKEVRWGNIHHRDGKPGNNALENLQLLCVRCHAEQHRA